MDNLCLDSLISDDHGRGYWILILSVHETGIHTTVKTVSIDTNNTRFESGQNTEGTVTVKTKILQNELAGIRWPTCQNPITSEKDSDVRDTDADRTG